MSKEPVPPTQEKQLSDSQNSALVRGSRIWTLKKSNYNPILIWASLTGDYELFILLLQVYISNL